MEIDSHHLLPDLPNRAKRRPRQIYQPLPGQGEGDGVALAQPSLDPCWSKCDDGKVNALSWGVGLVRYVTERLRRPTIQINSFRIFPYKLFPTAH